jgi:hypothetical protein
MKDSTREHTLGKSNEALVDFDCEYISGDKETAVTAIQGTIRVSLVYAPLFNSLRTVPSISFSLNGFGIMASTPLMPALSQCLSSVNPVARMTGIFRECSSKIRADSQTFI